MKYKLSIFFLLTISKFTFAQFNAQIYTNNNNECICLYKDKFYYRLKNNDAFNTYSIGIGYLIYEDDQKHYISKDKEILSKTSVISEVKRNDQCIKLKVTDSKRDSIPYSKIIIRSEDTPPITIQEFTDNNGEIILSEEQIKSVENKSCSVYIESLGFTTQRYLLLKRGNDYIIQSNTPSEYPFTISSEKRIIISIISVREIEIQVEGSKEVTLTLNDHLVCCPILNNQKFNR